MWHQPSTTAASAQGGARVKRDGARQPKHANSKDRAVWCGRWVAVHSVLLLGAWVGMRRRRRRRNRTYRALRCRRWVAVRARVRGCPLDSLLSLFTLYCPLDSLRSLLTLYSLSLLFTLSLFFTVPRLRLQWGARGGGRARVGGGGVGRFGASADLRPHPRAGRRRGEERWWGWGRGEGRVGREGGVGEDAGGDLANSSQLATAPQSSAS